MILTALVFSVAMALTVDLGNSQAIQQQNDDLISQWNRSLLTDVLEVLEGSDSTVLFKQYIPRPHNAVAKEVVVSGQGRQDREILVLRVHHEVWHRDVLRGSGTTYEIDARVISFTDGEAAEIEDVLLARVRIAGDDRKVDELVSQIPELEITLKNRASYAQWAKVSSEKFLMHIENSGLLTPVPPDHLAKETSGEISEEHLYKAVPALKKLLELVRERNAAVGTYTAVQQRLSELLIGDEMDLVEDDLVRLLATQELRNGRKKGAGKRLEKASGAH